MIFTYWDGPLDHIQPAIADWTSSGLPLSVYDDRAVLPILERRYGNQLAAIYQRIRIAACKSDIARLALLEEFGGMYVDSHAGTGDLTAMLKVFSHLANVELVLFENDDEDRRSGRGSLCMSVAIARANASIIPVLMTQISKNLQEHFERESLTADYVPYKYFCAGRRLAGICHIMGFDAATLFAEAGIQRTSQSRSSARRCDPTSRPAI